MLPCTRVRATPGLTDSEQFCRRSLGMLEFVPVFGSFEGYSLAPLAAQLL